VAVSKGVAERLRTIPGIDFDRVHVIYNPAWFPEIESRALEPPRHPWFEEHNVPIILSVGRLVPQKDYPTLIRAFELLRRRRKARLLILGEDRLRPDLERMITKLHLNDCIQMPGFVANPWSYMACASVFVLSSAHEGFGNVLVEAMACGTPVVSTDCPSGPAEILDFGRYGPLVPVGDAVALAEGIEAMIDNPTPPHILKRRAQEFSEEKAALHYLRLFNGAP